jgi:hypothetical protein
VELLEARALPSSVPTFGANAQHTSLYAGPSQSLNQVVWKTPVDLMPQYTSGGELLIHYGAPLVTAGNTVIVPVKTGATNGFRIDFFNGDTGGAATVGGAGVPKFSLSTDYILPSHNWTPSYSPVLASDGAGGTRLYYAGAGGTIYYINNPDSATAPTPTREVFYTTPSDYTANATSGNNYNSQIFVDTPITADSSGDIFFGFRFQGTHAGNTPTQSGYARITPGGTATYVLAGTAAGDATVVNDSHNLAPALSNDEKVLYVGVKGPAANSHPYLLGLDSTTLATKYKVALKDPRNSTTDSASIYDDSTATPLVAPDGTVFFGVLLQDPWNGSRGAMLHFSADLATEYAPDAFGWDNTNAIVPASMVPQYHGTSTFLLFSKYNNYADGGGDNGDGVNKIAILDPYATEVDPHASSNGLLIMREVLTVAGPTPDPNNISVTTPHATREWCINTAAVDQATDSVITPSEDGNIYRWSLANDSLVQTINLGTGIGEAYVPTIINPNNGQILTINNATLFAIGRVSGVGINITSSAPSNDTVVTGQTLTFTASITDINNTGHTPTGTVTFKDALTNGTTPPPATTLAASVALNGSGQATYTTSSLASGSHFISIDYSGDSHFSAGSIELVQNIHASATTTTLTSSPSPMAFGGTVTFSATVSPTVSGLGAPTGMVVFTEGTTVLGQEAVDSSGNATFTTTSLGAGTHTVTAAYHSDPIYASSRGNDSASPQEITQATTTLSDVSSSLASPYSFGQTVTYTATVSVTAPGGGTVAGTVTFKNENGTLGSAAVGAAGVATFSTASVTVGTHTITASYGGSANYTSSNDFGSASPLVQTVTQSTSGIAVTVPSGTTYFGQPMTYFATVTNTGGGTGAPTGTVSFTIKNGTTTITGGPETLSAINSTQSQAKFVTTGAMGGITQTVSASYGGDTNFSASGPVTGTNVITAAVTKTVLSVSANNLFFGAPWTPIAHVLVVPGKGGGTPGSSGLGAAGSGNVVFTATILTNASATNTFQLGGTFTQTLGTATVNTNGGASLPHPILPGNLTVFNSSGVATSINTAAYTITAAFTSTGVDFASSPASPGVVENVNGNVTTVTQVSAFPQSPAPQVGQKVTITAIVTATGSSLIQPLGSVTFKDAFGGSTTALATVTLPVAQVFGVRNVTVTMTTTSLARGAHALSVVYNPDATTLAPDFTSGTGFSSFVTPIRGQWVTSTSGSFGEVIKPITTFGSLSANPASQTDGRTVTFTDTVTSGTGAIPSGLVQFLDGGVTLGATSLNASGKATFATNSLSAGSHSVSAVYNASGNFAGDTSNTLTYTVSKASTTTKITGASSRVINQGTTVTFTASVTGSTGLTPTGSVVFVVESDARTAANQSPAFGGAAGVNPSNLNPFTLGTATLSGGVAKLAVPFNATPDIYEIEAFYNGDVDNIASHSQTVNPGPASGPRGFEEVVQDTSTFLRLVSITPASPGNSSTVTFTYQVRPSAQAGFPGLTAETGGFGGSVTLNVDGKDIVTRNVLSLTGQVSLTDANVSIATHTVMVTYNGDAGNPTVLSSVGYAAYPAGTLGWLPGTSVTFSYSRTSAASSVMPSTSNSTAALAMVPENHASTTAPLGTTTSPKSTAELNAVSVDGYFASTTTHQTPRTLAGALAKVHSGDDWLGGGF